MISPCAFFGGGWNCLPITSGFVPLQPNGVLPLPRVSNSSNWEILIFAHIPSEEEVPLGIFQNTIVWTVSWSWDLGKLLGRPAFI